MTSRLALLCMGLCWVTEQAVFKLGMENLLLLSTHQNTWCLFPFLNKRGGQRRERDWGTAGKLYPPDLQG